jgi:hypothetical protein
LRSAGEDILIDELVDGSPLGRATAEQYDETWWSDLEKVIVKLGNNKQNEQRQSGQHDRLDFSFSHIYALRRPDHEKNVFGEDHHAVSTSSPPTSNFFIDKQSTAV